MKKKTLKQMLRKKFTLWETDERFQKSFGKIGPGFIMIVWGQSGHGKSNFVFQLMNELYRHGKILYLALEESFSLTLQKKSEQNLDEDVIESGKVSFMDHSCRYEDLCKILHKGRSAKIVIVDSVQYFDINYPTYKKLKEQFPKKSFIFISHATGNYPAGKTADKIRYDAGIKVRVEGKVAFVESRYGGNKPWIIWKEGAKKYWKENFKNIKKEAK